MRVIARLDEPQPGEPTYGWTITYPRQHPDHLDHSDLDPEPPAYEQTRPGAYQALKWWMTYEAVSKRMETPLRVDNPAARRRRFRRRKAEEEQEAHRRQARARARRQVADLINTEYETGRISIELPPYWMTGQPQDPLQGQIHADPEPPTRQPPGGTITRPDTEDPDYRQR